MAAMTVIGADGCPACAEALRGHVRRTAKAAGWDTAIRAAVALVRQQAEDERARGHPEAARALERAAHVLNALTTTEATP